MPSTSQSFCLVPGFAGADYDLQDALVESTDKKTKTREVDGQTFYDYELSGPVSAEAHPSIPLSALAMSNPLM